MNCKKRATNGQYGPAPGNLVKISHPSLGVSHPSFSLCRGNFGVSSKILVPNGVQLHNRFFWQKKILAPWDMGDEVFFRLAGKWSLTRTEVGWILRCFRNLTFVKHEVWNHISTLTQSNFSRFGYLNLLRWRGKSCIRRILSSGSFCLIGGKSLRRRLVSRSDTFLKNVHFSGSFWALARTPVKLLSMLRWQMKA